jgi:hypothetical protein
MSTNPDLFPEPSKKSIPAKFLPLIIIGALLVVIVVPMILFFATLSSEGASRSESESPQSTMQKSLLAHGINVDLMTAERVRRACVQSGAVTTDVIAEFQGSKQVVTVQCGDNNDVFDAVVRSFAPNVNK